jgi:hypothetical protein
VKPGTEAGTEIVNHATLTDDALGGTASATTMVKQPPPKKGNRADAELVMRGNSSRAAWLGENPASNKKTSGISTNPGGLCF